MKSIFVKIATGLLGGGLIAYCVWLWTQGVLVTGGLYHWTMLALGGCMLVGIGLLIAVVHPALLPQNRRSIALMGAFIVLIAHMYLTDSPTQYIFLRDVMKVIGVYLVIVGPMKLLIPKKVQEELEQKDVEIIEV